MLLLASNLPDNYRPAPETLRVCQLKWHHAEGKAAGCAVLLGAEFPCLGTGFPFFSSFTCFLMQFRNSISADMLLKWKQGIPPQSLLSHQAKWGRAAEAKVKGLNHGCPALQSEMPEVCVSPSMRSVPLWTHMSILWPRNDGILIGLKFTKHNINRIKVDNSVMFSIFTMLCNPKNTLHPSNNHSSFFPSPGKLTSVFSAQGFAYFAYFMEKELQYVTFSVWLLLLRITFQSPPQL